MLKFFKFISDLFQLTKMFVLDLIKENNPAKQTIYFK